jgi:POT family proton-dependent oligopeptide transporter
MQSSISKTEEPKKGTYPKSIPYIIGNEAAERFSFYGMKAILPTFLVAQFFNPAHNPALQVTAEAESNKITHLFTALAYFMPLVGGILADWFFGKYKVIFYISIVYTLGHLCLALFDTDISGFSFGIFLVAFGAGCIKSNVSANVGDQFDSSNEHLMSKMYGWFYFSINSGSVISNIMIPVVYAKYGAGWAFGVPGILMALATLIFWLGRKQYVRKPPSGINKNNFVFISAYALANLGKKKSGESWLDVAKAKFDPVKVDYIKSVYSVLAIFAFIPMFWALWDQCLAEWVLQATKMDLVLWGDLGFLPKVELLPEQVQSFNPAFILISIPLFTYIVYPFFEKIKLTPTPIRRIGFGLLLTATSFVIIALIQQSIDAGGKPSVWWQVFAYLILAFSEVLVSITGLEYAYTNSPKSMKSTMTALFYFAVTVGNLFTAQVNHSIAEKGFFAMFTGASYYWMYVGLMLLNFLIYLFVASRVKERRYVGEPETA